MATTSAEYIQHHLQNLTFGKLPAGYQRADGSIVEEATWTLARTSSEAADMGFMAVHVDTLGWSIFMGLLFLGLFRFVAKRATVDTPSGLQNFVEIVVEFVQGIVKDTFHGRNPLIAPLALTIFVWIFLMKSLKWSPVDYLQGIAIAVSLGYLTIVPTTDPNATFGMSIAVFALIIYYSIKMKGVGGFTRELTLTP